jgi:hypothetical protein
VEVGRRKLEWTKHRAERRGHRVRGNIEMTKWEWMESEDIRRLEGERVRRINAMLRGLILGNEIILDFEISSIEHP